MVDRTLDAGNLGVSVGPRRGQRLYARLRAVRVSVQLERHIATTTNKPPTPSEVGHKT
jgi:hypothetical protein